MVTGCRSRWGPSIHRSRWGIREDHALVCCEWKWRLRQIDLPERKDYSLLANLQKQNATEKSIAEKFNAEFKKQLREIQSATGKTGGKDQYILYQQDGTPFEVPKGYRAMDA